MSNNDRPEGYEKPIIKRHAVVTTMASAGCKMGHGLFPFVTKRSDNRDVNVRDNYAYRRVLEKKHFIGR